MGYMCPFVYIICNSSYRYQQRPHDHLLQKSRHRGASKIDKFDFFSFMIAAKYITRHVICVNLITLYIIHHIGITQRPHDHLFQKSMHHGATWVHKLVSKQKSISLIFSSLCLLPNSLPDTLFVSICSHYM